MKVHLEIGKEYHPPSAVIYTDCLTEDLQEVIRLLEGQRSPILVRDHEESVILQPGEIYMIRVEGGQTLVYTKTKCFLSSARLREIRSEAGADFLQISKQTLVNLSYLDRLEAGFGGNLLLKLKNGLSDYVSRRYLPDFKRRLGI